MILRKYYRKAKRVALQFLGKEPVYFCDIKLNYELLGTDYGGWPLVEGLLSDDSIVYSFGVGDDVSFDLEIINKIGCEVHAFDPTPRSVQWVRNQKLDKNLCFHECGISNINGQISFSSPANPNHMSFTATKKQEEGTFSCVVKTLETIMETLGHQKIDLLKMDIEGSEYDVINDVMQKSCRPRAILVEFHHRMYGISSVKTKQAILQLKSAGYKIFYISSTGREFGFMFDDITEISQKFANYA